MEESLRWGDAGSVGFDFEDVLQGGQVVRGKELGFG